MIALIPMKTYIKLLILLSSFSLLGQVQTINTGEKEWYYSYYETLGEFSPKNIPANYRVSETGKLVWKNGNRIYMYGSDYASKSSFWVFDMDIHQWKCIEPDESQINWGQKGVFTPTNDPGKRYGKGITWTDTSGNLYLLNGGGPAQYNDLWKYDIILEQWAWIGGYNDNSGNNGNHGGIGEGSPDFFPSNRDFAMAISDNEGYIYVYGGAGGVNNQVKRKDLWRYNTENNSWALIYENPLNPNHYDNAQNIVEIGVEDEMNHPGYLMGYTSWFYNGYLWFFGGCYSMSSPSENCYNQVWKYNISNGLWTCVKYPDDIDEVFGNQGVSDELNTPPGLRQMSNSVIIGSEVFFFGGYDPEGFSEDLNSGVHNSLWKYNMNTNQWTWVKGNEKTLNPGFYGRKNEEYEYNTPSAREKSYLWVDEGNIYLFGGESNFQNIGGYFDVWKFNLQTNNFSWIDGKSYKNYQYEGDYNNHVMIYDENTPSVYNFPETYSGMYWGANGEKLWVMHGDIDPNFELGGLWEYDIETSKNYLVVRDLYHGEGNYGELGVANESNFPPLRIGTLLWETQDKLYLMGGRDNQTVFNDFWEFDKMTHLWTWKGGVQYNQTEYNHYGEIGVPSAENYPRSRENAATWVDEFGNLWLQGGSSAEGGLLNDFWKYEPSNGLWTLIGGGYNNCQYNSDYFFDDYPSCVKKHSSWRKGNDLYFFGGEGIGLSNTGSYSTGDLTDIWKYSIVDNDWKKVFGNRHKDNPANYGIFQIAQLSNQIGAYPSYTYWDDEYGNLWVYCGSNNGDYALWKFDTTIENWIWMDGTNEDIMWNDEYFDYYNYNFFGIVGAGALTYKGIGKNYLFNAGTLWEIDFGMYPNHYNKIEGIVKYDETGDCESSGTTVSNYKFKLNELENQLFFSDQNGYYKIFTPFLENTIVPLGFDNLYFSVNPSMAQVDFDSFGNNETVDFCLSPAGEYNDLEVYIIPINDPRPGLDAEYKIIYKNKGNTSLSGEIEFNFQEGLFEFISSVPNVDVQNPGVLVWNYSNLNPFETREILLTLNLSTSANSGDEVELTTIIYPIDGDQTESDNTFVLSQTVVNSYDPNDKTCLEGELIYDDQVGEFVHYLIRFENTGTADAINVVIKDEIDTSKFDINTLTPIESSHNFHTKINENNIDFTFENINLSFEENSNTGYILFKIKTLDSLQAGDEFSNGADIIFDYNEPIVTNNYTTQIEGNLSSIEELQNSLIQVYPNPTKGVLNIISNDLISKIEIFDMKGRILFVFGNPKDFIDISSLSNGIYITKIHTDKGVFSYKVIKQ